MIKLFVPGVAQPQGRPRLGKYGNFYSPKSDWHRQFFLLARKNYPKIPLTGTLSIQFYFQFPRPKSISKKKKWKSTRPDTDNLMKGCLDILQKAGWFKDDGAFAFMAGSKFYVNDSKQVGTDIVIEIMEAE